MARRAALRATVSAISAARDVRSALKLGLDAAVDALDGSAGSVHLADQTGALRLIAMRSMPDDARSHLDIVGQQSEPFARAIAGRDAVFVSKSAYDVSTVGPFASLPSSALVVTPILPAHSPVGALVVMRESGRPFGPNDVLLATAIAAELTLRIDGFHREDAAAAAAADRERQRLSRDLHDSAIQLLHGVALFAETGRRALARHDDAEAEQALDRVSALGQMALAELRVLVHSFQPVASGQHVLVDSLENRLAMVERRTGVDAVLQIDGEVTVPPPEQEQLYRIAQEALNNTLRHAGATRVEVYVRACDDYVEVEVTDNGSGFDEVKASSQHGLGLANMRERAEQLGGFLEVKSALGVGTTVVVSLDKSRQSVPGLDPRSA